MSASGNYVCHQARILFAEGLGRMKTVEERRQALGKLLLEILSTDVDPHLEKLIRIAYNDLQDVTSSPPTSPEDGNER